MIRGTHINWARSFESSLHSQLGYQCFWLIQQLLHLAAISLCIHMPTSNIIKHGHHTTCACNAYTKSSSFHGGNFTGEFKSTSMPKNDSQGMLRSNDSHLHLLFNIVRVTALWQLRRRSGVLLVQRRCTCLDGRIPASRARPGHLQAFLRKTRVGRSRRALSHMRVVAGEPTSLSHLS
jgi:hypothetical protein